MYKKLTRISLAILAATALISCNSGSGSSSPTPAPTTIPPSPSSQWVDSGLKNFLNTTDLTSYNFDTVNMIDTQQKLYLVGSNGTQKAIISFDLNKQVWSNVTYGLNSYDVTLKVPTTNSNSPVYAISNNTLYVLGSNSWQQVGSIPNGYTIKDLYGNSNANFILLLVNNGTNSIVYQVNGTSLVSTATINFAANGLSISNSINQWVAYNNDNYAFSSALSNILNLPSIPDNYRYILSNAGSAFIYQKYLCTFTGCKEITGASPAPMDTISYRFTNATMSNAGVSLSSNVIGYNSGSNYYTCDLNTQTAVASNCNALASYTGNYLFAGHYVSINNSSLSLGRSLESFSYYTIINDTWTNISPTTKPDEYFGFGISYCPYNPTSSILYASGTSFTKDYSKAIDSGYYADPFSNEWINLNVPDGGDFSTVGLVTSTSGSTITQNNYGFKSIKSENGYISNLYTYKYDAPCSKTY